MKRRDVRIYPVSRPGINSRLAFAMSFRNPDPRKAQAVVQELITNLQEINLLQQRRPGHAPQRRIAPRPAALTA